MMKWRKDEWMTKQWTKRKWIKRGTAVLCAGALAALPMAAHASSTSELVPADAVSGGVVHSSVYGEVLVTRSADGTYNYTFFNDDWPAVQVLLQALNSGTTIDLDKLLTESSTSIQKITTEDDVMISNDILNSGAAVGNRGTYSSGTVYGSNLKSAELQQLQAAVSNFLVLNSKVSSMSDVDKVRTAHDFLVLNCSPTSSYNSHHADNAWGALVYGEANGKGYARAMKALCDAVGINSYIMSANGNSARQDYMWNTVQIDGEWYIVDVFCDDSMSDYSMYLISDSTYMAYGMRWNTGENIPVCKNNYSG